jgi:LPXTG-site transpeptidase (sortase) family protein
MCIAGHNYNNYQFFSRLRKLNIGDSIYIYDLNGKKIEYIVYKNYETNSNDLSCTNQNTDGKREITLITCNNIKTQRRIVKAREKD